MKASDIPDSPQPHAFVAVSMLPVQKPTEEHGELGSDECHHGRGDEVAGGVNAIDDGHAAGDTEQSTQWLRAAVTMW